MPKRTQLYSYHANKGKLTEFAGFEMPLWYSSITEEHMAVRNSAGLFDVSHMGRIMIRGNDAEDFLCQLLPTDSTKIAHGRCFYTVLCNEKGGIIDDVIVSKFSTTEYYMVANAGNREKDLSWIKKFAQSYDVSVEDFSDSSALMAIQGPMSSSLLQQVVSKNLSEIRRFTFFLSHVLGEDCIISRTGYTGEDGYEITVRRATINNAEGALAIWNHLLDLGKSSGVLPCGLGARDTLRLEAGMCLYGQDIDDLTTPLEASLESVIDFDERDFVGKESLIAQKRGGISRKRVAFAMIEPGIPRHSYDVVFADKRVGVVTSGTYSPLLRKGIGMAYVPPELSDRGQKLGIKIRDAERTCEISSVPLFDTTRYGFKRKV